MDNTIFPIAEDVSTVDTSVFIDLPQGRVNVTEKKKYALKSGAFYTTDDEHFSYQDRSRLTGPEAAVALTPKEQAKKDAAEAFATAFNDLYLTFRQAWAAAESL